MPANNILHIYAALELASNCVGTKEKKIWLMFAKELIKKNKALLELDKDFAIISKLDSQISFLEER